MTLLRTIRAMKKDPFNEFVDLINGTIEANLQAIYDKTWYTPEMHNSEKEAQVDCDGRIHLYCHAGDRCLIFLYQGELTLPESSPHDSWFKIPHPDLNTNHWLLFAAI
jgi:hypothetical protein